MLPVCGPHFDSKASTVIYGTNQKVLGPIPTIGYFATVFSGQTFQRSSFLGLKKVQSDGRRGKGRKRKVLQCILYLVPKEPQINQPNSAQLIRRRMPSCDKVLFTLRYEHFALQCNLNLTLLRQNKKSQQYVCSHHSFHMLMLIVGALATILKLSLLANISM